MFTFHGVQGVHLLQSRIADKPDGLTVSFVVKQFQGALVQEDVLGLEHNIVPYETLVTTKQWWQLATISCLTTVNVCLR